MINRTNIALFGLATVCGTIMVGGSAKAQPVDQPFTVQGHFDPEVQRIVHFADLNLANPEGRQVLMRRVNHAVNDLCNVSSTAAFATYTRNRECTKAAWNSAKPQLDALFTNTGSAATVAIAIVAH